MPQRQHNIFRGDKPSHFTTLASEVISQGASTYITEVTTLKLPRKQLGARIVLGQLDHLLEQLDRTVVADELQPRRLLHQRRMSLSVSKIFMEGASPVIALHYPVTQSSMYK